MREWGKRKTETRGEKTLRFLKSLWGRISFFFGETECGSHLVAFGLLFLMGFGIYSCTKSSEISLEKKKELYEAISSHRSDPELRTCEETLAKTNGKIIREDFWEYNSCISEIEKRRKEEEAQRELDSLGIWKREQADE